MCPKRLYTVCLETVVPVAEERGRDMSDAVLCLFLLAVTAKYTDAGLYELYLVPRDGIRLGNQAGGINPCRIQMKEADNEIKLWVLFDYSKYAQNFGMAKCGRPLELVTMETTEASIDYFSATRNRLFENPSQLGNFYSV
ncbi:hypothetical protein TNCV_2264191 [Trichonephila clavipes]|nr:hypothetical protein TNCV_2264191 [Trichonephila clavipes]